MNYRRKLTFIQEIISTLKSTFLNKPTLSISGILVLILFFQPIHTQAARLSDPGNKSSSDSTRVKKEKKKKDEDEDKPHFKIGGALRYNLFVQDYKGNITQNDYQMTFDTWRINVTGSYDDIDLVFEYRFYPTFNTHFIKKGYLGYHFSKASSIQLGVTQVPFGNLTYASHSWWFQIPYYVGLEDDWDMGLKYIYKKKNWDVMLAYFVQPEPSGPAYGAASFGVGGPGRYSYDIIPVTGSKPWDYVLGQNGIPQSNEERHTINARIAYTFDHGDLGNTTIGASGMVGGLYNMKLHKSGTRTAFSLHLNGNYGRFNLKTEYVYYNYDGYNDLGQKTPFVYMGAYGDPYPVASEANTYVAGLSYGLPVDFGPISKLTFYNDYGYVDKTNKQYYDTQFNVLGFMITAGDVYTYFDIASGKNQPWLTRSFGKGLGPGQKDAPWNTRFNINIGFYF